MRWLCYSLVLLVTGVLVAGMSGCGSPSVASAPTPPLSPATIQITAPQSRELFQQVSGAADVPVSATAYKLPAGGGVEFVLDLGTPAEKSARVCTEPFQHTFKSVPSAEHTLDAFVITSTGVRTTACDHRDRVGVGDLTVAVGDSITAGEDDESTTDYPSADGRNGPFTDQYGTIYGGFEPTLNNLLTASLGYPQSVVNKGWPGDKASDGAAKIGAYIAQYPTAGRWLIAYGTNDSNSGVGAGAFESNLRSMISQIHAANPSAKIFLPKVFYWPKPVVYEYNNRMENIAATTPNVYMGADLFTPFRQNFETYNNMTQQPGTWFAPNPVNHPNALGIQQMALLWREAILSAPR